MFKSSILLTANSQQQSSVGKESPSWMTSFSVPRGSGTNFPANFNLVSGLHHGKNVLFQCYIISFVFSLVQLDLDLYLKKLRKYNCYDDKRIFVKH